MIRTTSDGKKPGPLAGSSSSGADSTPGSASRIAPLSAMDRRRFLLTAGAGTAGAIAANNLTGVREAQAAGEVPPSYRVPSYRDLYGGKWEDLIAKGSTDSLYGRKILRPEDFNHGTVTTRDPRGYDVKFHYVREGSGEPLFLFHGWPGFWWDYWMNIKELAKHFDVIAVDMRGYGDSDKPGYDPTTNRIKLDRGPLRPQHDGRRSHARGEGARDREGVLVRA